ncbi:hypothetical protein J8I88_19560 (plasmid) [Duffyella gerundensis]|uniref:hypothetical protein n=1 Tax=Duffyella gerundensis TaxID=1619313 RepID=UPI001AEA3C3D|nr:hypothetical protein [Duffyella gerundensis]QTO56190.1 hypothetical protein J8I88_19560 [Duffyella gerundensis]
MKINTGTLLDYLNVTLENSNNHVQEHPQLMNLVLQMDLIFQKEIFDHEFEVNPIAGLLAMNYYTQLLSAVNLALPGNQAAIFPNVRTALESACYAYLIAHNKAMAEVWLNRHTTKNSLDKCRKIFSVKKASNDLKNLSPEMAEYVMAHYNAAIDFGAHPNRKAIFHHLTDMGEVDERHHGFELTCVYGRNSWHVNYALLICTEIGQAIAFLPAACTEKHLLIHDRLEVFESWIDEKNQMAEKMNSEPLDYSGPMYCSVIPPE